MSQHEELLDALSSLIGTLEIGFATLRSQSEPATRHDLHLLEKRIMSQISTILDPIAGQVAQDNVLLTQAAADIQTIAAAITAGGVGSISPADITELTNAATGVAAVSANVATVAASLHTLALSITTAPASTITPVATASPLTGTAPLSVTFNTTGSVDSGGASLTFSTDYGDKTAVDALLSHTYELAGTYVATVTVSNGVSSINAPPITIAVS